jgi:hypothetical protein
MDGDARNGGLEMNRRFLWAAVLVVLSSGLALAAAPVPVQELTYAGSFLNPFGQENMCFLATSDGAPTPGVRAGFFGQTVWGGTIKTWNFGTSNLLGKGCLSPQWPEDVYAVQAVGDPTGLFPGVVSAPKVMTIYRPIGHEFAADGELCITPDPWTKREASFGFLFALPGSVLPGGSPTVATVAGNPFIRMLYLDLDNPGGPVRIWTIDYSFVMIVFNSTTHKILFARIDAPAFFQQNGQPPQYGRMHLELNGGGPATFDLTVTRMPNQVLYSVSDVPVKNGATFAQF